MKRGQMHTFSQMNNSLNLKKKSKIIRITRGVAITFQN